jgi:hypothetical protein
LRDVFSGDPAAPASAAKLYLDGPDRIVPKGAFIELFVPAGARVWVKGGTGEVDATGVQGELNITMVGGMVRVNGKLRALDVSAMDASVTVTGQADWARIRTGAGDIVVSGGSSDAAFSSVSGALSVGGGTFERGRFESVTGRIAFTGDVARGASLVFDTHSGGIDLLLSPRINASVDAESITGAIDNLLNGIRASSSPDGRGQTLVMAIGASPPPGAGGARITARTFRGVVRLGPAKTP